MILRFETGAPFLSNLNGLLVSEGSETETTFETGSVSKVRAGLKSRMVF